MENNSLAHHGTKGMRWGIRRYQNRDGSLTPAGKRRVQKQQQKNLEKARKAKAEKKQRELEAQEHARNKEKVLASGNASEVLKYKGELTKQQMDSAIARIRWEQDMKSLASKEVETGKSKVDKFFAGLGDATGKAKTAFQAWNTVANVANALLDLDVQLPKIDTNIDSGNRNQRNNEKKKLEGSGDKDKKKKKDDD